MKTTLAILGGAVLLVIGFILGAEFGSGTRCETITAQERVGHEIVLVTLHAHFAHKIEQLEMQTAFVHESAQKQRKQYVALQQELGAMIGRQVVIPEPKPIPISAVAMPKSWDGGSIKAKVVYKTSMECKDTPCATVTFEQEPIEQLAALAPVEATVKEVAKQEGGWLNVPYIKEQLWKGAALAYGMRGK